MIFKVSINEFRQFKDKEIFLGKRLTVLAGRNSTGKSTILGILANCAEIKKKQGTTYAGKQFRAEFSEIFHGSERFDKSGSNKIRIDVADNNGMVIDYREFRTAWQNNNGKKRFRIIPFKKKEDNSKTEAKMSLPVLYLGLSRLYPIGEAEHSSIKPQKIKFYDATDVKWFIEKYKYILSLNDEITEIDNYKIAETDKKSGVAILTDKYDVFANSSGQDNLGQILMAILSFKQLKRNDCSAWQGGLLLIDEVDSTLHPAAQKRLIDILQKEGDNIGIQIVVTTHSAELIRHVCTKIRRNSENIVNNIEVYYFTNANKSLQIKRNSTYPSIKNDLFIEAFAENEKLKVYSEDEENRWFLKKLLQDYMDRLNVLDISIGCNELLTLYSADIDYFGNVLIVLDGDVEENVIDKCSHQERLKNIIKLPGKVRPEKVLFDYIHSLESEHPFWERAETVSVTWQYVHDNSPNSPKYNKFTEDRKKYKEWFNHNKSWIDSLKVFEFWSRDNREEVDEFIENFVNAYNAIADRNCLAHINR